MIRQFGYSTFQITKLTYNQIKMIQTAKRLETVQEYYFSRKLKEVRQLMSEGKPIINMGIGSQI